MKGTAVSIATRYEHDYISLSDSGNEATEARVDALRNWSIGEDCLAVRSALGIGVE